MNKMKIFKMLSTKGKALVVIFLTLFVLQIGAFNSNAQEGDLCAIKCAYFNPNYNCTLQNIYDPTWSIVCYNRTVWPIWNP